MDGNFVDKDGSLKKMYMGSYGIGIGRAMAIDVEVHHDDVGIIWPKNITPYQVHLIGLDGMGEDLYQDLLLKNIDVLFDDREISAGEKFADADLIGIPIRLVISKRSQEKGGIEYKLRSEKDTEIIESKDLVSKIIKFYN